MTGNLFVLYVADQARSAAFYAAVLGREPRLDVPGMTEFDLPGGGALGLMPEAGIKRLLGDALPDPASARGVPRAELYLRVEDAGRVSRARADRGGAGVESAHRAGLGGRGGLQPRPGRPCSRVCARPDRSGLEVYP